MLYIVSMLATIEVEFDSVLTEYFPYSFFVYINENVVKEYGFKIEWELLTTLSMYGLILKYIHYGELGLSELFTKKTIKRQVYALLLLSFSNFFMFASDWAGGDIDLLLSCIGVVLFFVTHIYVVIGAYTGYSDKTNQWFDIFNYWYGYSFLGWVSISSLYYWSYLSDDGGWDENAGALLEPTVNALLICVSIVIIHQTLVKFHSTKAKIKHHDSLKTILVKKFETLSNLSITSCLYALILLFYWTIQILVINL